MFITKEYVEQNCKLQPRNSRSKKQDDYILHSVQLNTSTNDQAYRYLQEAQSLMRATVDKIKYSLVSNY